MTHVARPEVIRHCSGCGEEQPFEQLHAETASCPDVPDGECPEWGCAVCGEALFIGLPVREHVSSRTASRAALGANRFPAGSRLKLNRSNWHETGVPA